MDPSKRRAVRTRKVVILTRGEILVERDKQNARLHVPVRRKPIDCFGSGGNVVHYPNPVPV